MLQLRPNCEACDTDLDASEPEAFICSFECTFCRECSENKLDHTCPNCGGVLVARPTRAAALLKDFPASTARILKQS